MAPFYIFPSGLPQPADLFLIAGILISAFSFNYAVSKQDGFTILALLLLLHVIIINISTAILLSSTKTIKPIFFYSYNIMLLLFVVNLYKEAKVKLLTVFFGGTFFSLAVQFFYVYLIGTSFHVVRLTGTFNNPNQLGYYALASMGLLILTEEGAGKYRKISMLLGIIMSIMLVFASISKAAILAQSILICTYVFKKICYYKKTALLAIFFVLIVEIYFIPSNAEISRNLENRFVNNYINLVNRMSQINRTSDDTLLGRGYGRILSHPEFIFLGAGEGLLPSEDPRYDDPSLDLEIHSTFGTLLFSYGILGLTLFLIFLYLSVRGGSLYTAMPLMSLCLYGLTHQGLRFTPFWIVLAMTYIKNNKQKKKKMHIIYYK
jgi:hypothetical protein